MPKHPIGHKPPPASAGQLAQAMLRDQLNKLNSLYGQGKLPEALALAKTLAEKHANTPFPPFIMGNILAAQGRFGEATASFERALRIMPDLAEAHNNLANILNAAGEFEAAAERCRAALKIKPSFVEAHNNLGNALAALERHDEAIASYTAALNFKPDYAHAHNGLGNVLAALARHDEAIASYTRALGFKPGYALAHNGLGNVLNAAAASCNAALRLKPDFAETHNNLGNAHMGLGEFEEAAACYNRALRINPGFAMAIGNLGSALNAIGKLEEAIACCARALELAPRNAEARRLLAHILAQQGHMEESRANLMAAFEIDPASVSARLARGDMFLADGRLEEAQTEFEGALKLDRKNLYIRHSIARVRKVRKGDGNMLALMEEAENAASLPDTRAIVLHFALSKCYDDTGQYDLAFRHFAEGARIKRKRLQYSAGRAEQYVESIRRFFTAENIGRLRGPGCASKTPIFVLGMPRSGTTLTESILASHPLVVPRGELLDMKEISNRPRGEATAGYPLSLEGITPAVLAAMGERYASGLIARAPGALRITDKMPRNFFSVGLIHLMLPNAKIVHVRRDPADTCLSNFMQHFDRAHFHTYDLAELGRYYRGYAALMRHWRAVLPEGSFHEIRYESLVAEPEKEIRGLLDYCGLEWHDACLNFHETERQVLTSSVSQVRQPLYGGSMGKWRRYEKRLGPLFEALGDMDFEANDGAASDDPARIV